MERKNFTRESSELLLFVVVVKSALSCGTLRKRTRRKKKEKEKEKKRNARSRALLTAS